MKIKNIGITVAATLVFASCGTNKAIVKQPTTVKQTTAPTQSSVQKQKLQFVQKVSDQSLYQKNLVSDLSFTLNTGSRNISVPGILHMRRMRLSAFNFSFRSYEAKSGVLNLRKTTCSS